MLAGPGIARPAARGGAGAHGGDAHADDGDGNGDGEGVEASAAATGPAALIAQAGSPGAAGGGRRSLGVWAGQSVVTKRILGTTP